MISAKTLTHFPLRKSRNGGFVQESNQPLMILNRGRRKWIVLHCFHSSRDKNAGLDTFGTLLLRPPAFPYTYRSVLEMIPWIYKQKKITCVNTQNSWSPVGLSVLCSSPQHCFTQVPWGVSLHKQVAWDWKKKLKIALWTVSKTEGVSGSRGQPITIFFSSSPSFCSCLPPSAPADFAGDSAPFLEEIYLCLLLNSAAAAQTFPYHCVAMQSWFYQKSGVRLPWTRKSSTLIRKEGWLAGRQHDWLSLVSLGTQAEKVRK